MKPLKNTAILALALLCFTPFAATTEAQSGSRSRSSTPAAGLLIDVDFPGGTLPDYIQYLGTLVDGEKDNLNVVIGDGAKSVSVPAISFKRVQMSAAVEIIEELSTGNTSNFVKFKSGIYFINAATMRGKQGGGGAAMMGAARKPKVQQSETFVVSVQHILSVRSQEDLLSAIEIGLELVNSNNSDAGLPQLKLHSETGLLFGKGNRAQLAIISDTVQQLERQLSKRNPPAKEAGDPKSVTPVQSGKAVRSR